MDASRPRFELKYVVDPETADAFRDCIREAMEPDAHANAEDGYGVNSVYHDTPDLAAYIDKLDGVSERFKIRLRWYGVARAGALDDTAWFLEAKHRVDQQLAKSRVRLTGDQAASRLEGTLKSGLLGSVAPQQAENAAVIDGLVGRAPLEPQCIVSYHRQAWVSRTDPSLRVTFDTRLRVLAPALWSEAGAGNGALFLPADLCVLEIKFHWAIPLWIQDACQSVGLLQRRYSKYCSALERLRPEIALRSVRYRSPGDDSA